MKKKLQLNELKVSSFVTSESVSVKGGTGTVEETLFSCYAYISCNPLGCVNSRNIVCTQGANCTPHNISGSTCTIINP